MERRQLEAGLLDDDRRADGGQRVGDFVAEDLLEVERLDLGQMGVDRIERQRRQAARLGELSGVAGDQAQARRRAQLPLSRMTRKASIFFCRPFNWNSPSDSVGNSPSSWRLVSAPMVISVASPT